MSSTTTIASLLLLAMFIIFGVQYGIMAIGSTDQGVNMTGSAYEAQYHAGANASISSFALINHTPLLIGVMILVVAIVGLVVYVSGKRH